MPNFGATEILIILFVVLLLFGSAKLPQLARSLGRSARILKTETRGLHDDTEPEQGTGTGEQATPVARPPALPQGEPLPGLPVPRHERSRLH
ncbi:twin-arginine translocase TatA/TatE family subunit [Actinomadura rugatobispora]|uniref:Sec-independent protein translocase protein TatA n=1 Tax=Actinomadura rugatobispora TaxID=1994 RepID=A0ABW1AK02_9ACTN|nr:hypothetical protein GCM10010200_091790 [Actinomadura rugatobispora]